MDLFEPSPRTPGESRRQPRVGFKAENPESIYLGGERLDRYLEKMGLGWILLVRAFLWRLDWSELESRYTLTGRSPYAPAVVMGLVLYGTMKGVSSLRGLETLARTDVGAMWMTGGACPDHSSIGRFLELHAESLTEPFFEELTRGVVREIGSGSALLAGDGTIFEAAGSRYRMLTREAAEAAAADAASKAAQVPGDEELERKASEARAVADAAKERAEAQRRSGDKRPATMVSSTEPEAAVIKGKKGVTAPSYVASVMADDNRVIHALHVAQTDEQSAVEPMLDQAERVGDVKPTVLLDGAYAIGPVAQLAAERELDLITPPRQPKAEREHFDKLDFVYDEGRDVYTCPAGQELTARGRGHDRRRGTRYTRYAAPTAVCSACPLIAQCVRAKTRKRRVILRYDHDEAMDALREVMKQPKAKQLLRKRKAIVEPVFSNLRGRQNLSRFRRFGLAGARLEFALHAAAHNLSRLIARWGTSPVPAFPRVLIATVLALLRGFRARLKSMPPPLPLPAASHPLRLAPA